MKRRDVTTRDSRASHQKSRAITKLEKLVTRNSNPCQSRADEVSSALSKEQVEQSLKRRVMLTPKRP